MDEHTNDEQSISINDLEYLPVTKNIRESLRVQRTEYIRQQLRRRQEKEDALLTQLLQEQRVIDGMHKQIDENLEQTEAGRKYNQEFKESMNAQVYALHGISGDKLEGMREYKNAYYKGCALSLFLLSAALTILCGVLHGFASELCTFMLAYTGIEGALLAQGKKRWKAVDWLCRLLYLLLFPVMMVIFVCYELKYPEYGIFLPYAVLAGAGVLIFTVLSYFLYSPYREAKKGVRAAQSHIADIEKTARKEVRKNKKVHKKEEKKQQNKQKKEDRRQERSIRRNEKKAAIKNFFVRKPEHPEALNSEDHEDEKETGTESDRFDEASEKDSRAAQPEEGTAGQAQPDGKTAGQAQPDGKTAGQAQPAGESFGMPAFLKKSSKIAETAQKDSALP